MYRDLFRNGNSNPENPLFGKVCQKLCSLGYSMGGASAAMVGVFADDSDNVRCVIPLHSNPIGVESYNLQCPIFYGGSTGDTLNPPTGRRGGLGQYGENSVAPAFGQILRGGSHIVRLDGRDLCGLPIPGSCTGESAFLYKFCIAVSTSTFPNYSLQQLYFFYLNI